MRVRSRKPASTMAQDRFRYRARSDDGAAEGRLDAAGPRRAQRRASRPSAQRAAVDATELSGCHMVIAVFNDADGGATVVDPEIPVLSIADLGVLRDVAVEQRSDRGRDHAEHSGCPAMNMITSRSSWRWSAKCFRQIRRCVPCCRPAWTTDWMTADGRRKLAEYGMAPPATRKLPPRAVRRGAGGLPAMRLHRHRGAIRIRLDLLQGAMALQKLPRTPSRLFQMSLTIRIRAPLSIASPSTICAQIHGCGVADLGDSARLAEDYPFAPGSI